MFHCSNWFFTGLVHIICVQYSRPSVIQICVQKTEFLRSVKHVHLYTELWWNTLMEHTLVFTIRTLIEQPLLILNKQQARMWIMEGPLYSGALQLPSKYLATLLQFCALLLNTNATNFIAIPILLCIFYVQWSRAE